MINSQIIMINKIFNKVIQNFQKQQPIMKNANNKKNKEIYQNHYKLTKQIKKMFQNLLFLMMKSNSYNIKTI